MPPCRLTDMAPSEAIEVDADLVGATLMGACASARDCMVSLELQLKEEVRLREEAMDVARRKEHELVRLRSNFEVTVGSLRKQLEDKDAQLKQEQAKRVAFEQDFREKLKGLQASAQILHGEQLSWDTAMNSGDEAEVQLREPPAKKLRPQSAALLFWGSWADLAAFLAKKRKKMPRVDERLRRAERLLGRELLKLKAYCEPARFTMELAAAEVFRDSNRAAPACFKAVGGFCIDGVLAAFVFAGTILFEDALRILCAREKHIRLQWLGKVASRLHSPTCNVYYGWGRCLPAGSPPQEVVDILRKLLVQPHTSGCFSIIEEMRATDEETKLYVTGATEVARSCLQDRGVKLRPDRVCGFDLL